MKTEAQTEAGMILEEMAKPRTAPELSMRKGALATASRLLLADHATEADVSRALALIELARELAQSNVISAAEAASYKAGALELRERAAQIIYDLYREPGGFDVSRGDLKNLAEAIGDMSVAQ